MSSLMNVSLSSNVSDLWKKCDALGNEMIVTSKGRRIYPTPEFSVTGLDPSKYYEMTFHIEHVDNKRLRFVDGRFQEFESKERKNTPRQIVHKLDAMSGRFWMDNFINFDSVRITNKDWGVSPLMIHLYANHKYATVVSIYEVDKAELEKQKLIKDKKLEEERKPRGICIHSARVPHTEFITVTAYHNDQINAIKSETNPFATGANRAKNGRGKQQKSAKKKASPAMKTPKKEEIDYQSPSTSPTQMKEQQVPYTPMDPLALQEFALSQQKMISEMEQKKKNSFMTASLLEDSKTPIAQNTLHPGINPFGLQFNPLINPLLNAFLKSYAAIYLTPPITPETELEEEIDLFN